MASSTTSGQIPGRRYPAVVQVRTASSRLHGKPLMKVMGKPLLHYLLERIRACSSIDRIVVATTTSPDDDELAAYCRNAGIEIFRGSEVNVMGRIFHCVEDFPDDYFVKFWGDSPLIDPVLCDEIISTLGYEFRGADYVSNNHPSTYPEGMQIEVVKINALRRAFHSPDLSDFDREHVTTAIWQSADRFRVENIERSPDIHDDFRLVVDYPEDFEQIRSLIEALYPSNPLFGLDEILRFLEENDEVLELNRRWIETEAAYYDRISDVEKPPPEGM